LDQLRELPFVREVSVVDPPAARRGRSSSGLKVVAPGRTYTFDLEVKRTFLDRALTNAVIAAQTARQEQDLPVFLIARYIPRSTGERLVAAGVNFVDRAGNVNLRLGEQFQASVLGRREPAIETTSHRTGPALVQLFFMSLAEPEAAAWPVRKIADEAGIGKTAAALGLQRLVSLGVLAADRTGHHRLVDRPRLLDDFLGGYAGVLRPHLEIGRFRSPVREPDAFLRGFAETAATANANWAAAGASAAYLLDRFFRTDDVTVFVENFTPVMQRALRLVPDRQGPIALFRSFGRRWQWKVVEGTMVADSLLIYAELLYSEEPRALEAADRIRERFLDP
jgi:hypothetical protein